MYGREPKFSAFSEPVAFDPTSYQAHLQARLAELHDFVHINLSEASDHQKSEFDKHSKERSFVCGDPVWVSILTAGKLDPRWDGRWTIKQKKEFNYISTLQWESAQSRSHKSAKTQTHER